MNYEIGDKVYFKNTMFIAQAEIVNINSDDEYKYYIKYKGCCDKEHYVWVKDNHIDGFIEGSDKYLKHELCELMCMYGMNKKTFLDLDIKLTKEGVSFKKIFEQAIQDFLDSCEEVKDV